MLRKMRKDELSGGCILFVVAEVHHHVQKMKNPLGQTWPNFRERCRPRLLSVFSAFSCKRKALMRRIFRAKKQLQRSSGSNAVP